jgi:(R,R)-butanediol dehydrogenase/meso-butanediol dehydrogenase/diacetyl reductase
MTLAVRYTAARTLDTAPVEASSPGPGEVELAPAYVGICGTDLHIFHGDMDARVAAPAVLGHEMSGRVVRVGPEVEGWHPGDAVTVMPLRWDGTCPACTRLTEFARALRGEPTLLADFSAGLRVQRVVEGLKGADG